ncbi:hypothetical protein ACOR62_02845 [Neisseria lisongii]|uniref:Uncharacterized protein n=1 Tax=Neisseria lisongii TaxID=2912188 RepID=A0AAW5AH56_9NEIS|nr:hypothetical protein [Neisseria lisongii]MCF7529407.1 hypothetical protein [Neisseria lisongii]
MKTPVLLTLMFAAATAVAADKPNTQAETNPPQIIFGTVSQNSNTLTPTTEVNQKDGRYCWVAVNVNAGSKATVEEFQQTPAGGSYTAPNASIDSNALRTQHKINFYATRNERGEYNHCWLYGNTDPLGDYETTVRIGDIQFPPIKWKLVR